MNRDEVSDLIFTHSPFGPFIRLSLQRGEFPPGMEAVSANLIGCRRDGGVVSSMADIVYTRPAGEYLGHLEVDMAESSGSSMELADIVAARWSRHVGWNVTPRYLFQLCTCLDALHLSRPCRPIRLSANMLVVQHLTRIQGALEHQFAGDEPPAAVIPVMTCINHILVSANKALAQVTRVS